jgi:hypothetical protein
LGPFSDDPNQSSHEKRPTRDPETGHRLLFIEVSDEKVVKNPLHLDLKPREGSGEEELARCSRTARPGCWAPVGTGAGHRLLVRADPEGTESSILRSEAEVNGKFQREHRDIESISGPLAVPAMTRCRGSRV